MKRIKIIFKGGFHNREKTVSAKENLQLSRGQFESLQREFCGMADCKCGGILRDTKIEGADGARYAIEYHLQDGGIQLRDILF